MRVTAKVTRSGEWWAVEVPEVPGVFTQAKRLAQVPEMVRDAVALMVDVDEDSVEVGEIQTHISGAVDEYLAHARELSEAAERASREASECKRRLVAELREREHLTVRDVGTLLEISPQRVSQLESA